MPEDQGNPYGGSSVEDSHSPKHGGPPLEAAVLAIDLPGELEHLRRQRNYLAGEPCGTTLVKDPDLRVVLMALQAGARMKEHSASGPISVQVLDGHLRVRLPNASPELTAGGLLSLEAGLRHDVEALADSAFLLTIGRTRYAEVSDWHEAEA